MDFTWTLSLRCRGISWDPSDLVEQLVGPHHQYPDGVVLFLGTMFAPTGDRDVPGIGFSHKIGDIVKIKSDKLGAPPIGCGTPTIARLGISGISQLMRSLAGASINLQPPMSTWH